MLFITADEPARPSPQSPSLLLGCTQVFRDLGSGDMRLSLGSLPCAADLSALRREGRGQVRNQVRESLPWEGVGSRCHRRCPFSSPRLDHYLCVQQGEKETSCLPAVVHTHTGCRVIWSFSVCLFDFLKLFFHLYGQGISQRSTWGAGFSSLTCSVTLGKT